MTFLLVEAQTLSFDSSHDCAHGSESVIFSDDLCKPIEQTKHRKFPNATKTSGLLLLHSTGVNFSSRNNFANLGSFAKVSVPVQFIIPWYAVLYTR